MLIAHEAKSCCTNKLSALLPTSLLLSMAPPVLETFSYEPSVSYVRPDGIEPSATEISGTKQRSKAAASRPAA